VCVIHLTWLKLCCIFPLILDAKLYHNISVALLLVSITASLFHFLVEDVQHGISWTNVFPSASSTASGSDFSVLESLDL